jgi:anti-anti-sigma factor
VKIIQAALADEVYRIAPEGRLDAVTVPTLEAVLVEHLDKGHVRLIADLRDVTYISSSGLRALLRARRQAQAGGGDVVLSGLSPRVHEVFEMIGFTSLFRLFDRVEEAAASFANSVAA